MSDLISREAAIAELCNRKRLLNTQLEALDISREDAVYSICIDALRALPPAQEAAPALARESAAPAVKVKPLVWECPYGFETAQTPWGRYGVSQWEDGWIWGWNGDVTRAESEDAAKAAAQADYESRILAALEGGEA